MTSEGIIAIGIAIMCLSIFIFNAIKTKDEYLWSEAIGAMLIFDLPIGGLLFWLFSLLSPVIACIWGLLCPFVIYKVCDYIDNRKAIKDTNTTEKTVQKGSASTHQVHTEIPTEENSINANNTVPSPVIDPTKTEIVVERKSVPIDNSPQSLVEKTLKSEIDIEQKQIEQTLMFCLHCRQKISCSICKECKYDNSSSILLLNKVDSRQLQISQK